MNLSLREVKKHRDFLFEECTKVFDELSAFDDGVNDLDDEHIGA